MVSVKDALASIVREVVPLPPVDVAVTPKLRGHVLAEDVYSLSNIPTSPTTNVDGYALRGKDFLLHQRECYEKLKIL